jgi:hypothetical protein
VQGGGAYVSPPTLTIKSGRIKKMTDETKELLKQANGKTVTYKYIGEKTYTMNCIVLAGPSNDRVSVKPYGHTPEELVEILKNSPFPATMKEVTDPSFCMSTLRYTSGNLNEMIQKIIDIPDDGFFVFDDICDGGGGNPICSY